MAAQHASIHSSPTQGTSRSFTRRLENMSAWLASATHRPSALAEIVVAMSLIIACCRVVRPIDPLLLSFDFPWLWVPATLFALRYGALLGMAAGFCILGAWMIFYPLVPGMEFPTMLFAGGFTQLIITGHFADVWHSRQRRCRIENEYLQRRLTSLTNNHYLLRVSHDRLEKEAFFGTSTLRDSLKDIRRLCGFSNKDEVLPGAEALLQFLADACQISSASIHAFGQDGLSKMPLASVGTPVPMDAANPLLQQCIQRRELCHIGSDPGIQNTYLACVPVTSTSGRLLAVLVVRDMAFEALNPSNLQFLLTLLGYYGGALEDRSTVMDIQRLHAACPRDFATELARLGHLGRHGALPSYLVGIRIPVENVCAMLEQRIQNAEMEGGSVWRIESVDRYTVIILYPLIADPDRLTAEWEAYLSTIGGQCRSRLVEPELIDSGLGNVISGLQKDG